MVNHQQLNAKQLRLLKIIYKFRFVTSDHVAKYRGVSKRAVNDAFKILLDQHYIARHYDKTYKLLGKGARYYLAPKSLRLLQSELNIEKTILQSRYRDKRVGEAFIDHSLQIFDLCLQIRDQKQDTFDMFTQSELASYDHFPQPLPDLYLKRLEPAEDKPNEYMVDTFNNVLAFVIQKRVDQYIRHFEDVSWDGKYPGIYIICANKRMQQKIQNYIISKLEENYIEEGELSLSVRLSLPRDGIAR